jgi:hypothetical protein
LIEPLQRRRVRRHAHTPAWRDTTEPNRLIILLYAGVAALTAHVLALGVGLLTA